MGWYSDIAKDINNKNQSIEGQIEEIENFF